MFAEVEMVIQRIYKDSEVTTIIREGGYYFIFTWQLSLPVNL